jgi:acyl carrier protein/pimeloyl-ACP methyl ester carboxylesterase
MAKLEIELTRQLSPKINRNSLALPTAFEAPVGELEQSIAAIFADVFELDEVGANDEFFDLGGDSLLAEPLSFAISEHTGCDFHISDLARYNSPRKIASLVECRGGNSLAPRPAADFPPIFLVHGRDGFMLPKPAFYEVLPPGQKLRMFELPGIRRGQPSARIEEIARSYVEQLIEEHPTGPILLGAFCRGGLIGIEMANQLAERGRPVCHLLLFDPGVPRSTVINHQRRMRKCTDPKTWRPIAQENWFFEPKHQAAKPLVHSLWFLLCWSTLGRSTDGCRDEDFLDLRLRYLRELSFRIKLWRRRRARSHRYAEFQLSIRAQAKLYAAYLHYMPRAYGGDVTILTSRKRHIGFEDENGIWASVLPRRRLHLVSARHQDITKADLPETARLMKTIFDTALGDMERSETKRLR